MKQKFEKIISLLLIFILFLSSSLTSFGYDSNLESHNLGIFDNNYNVKDNIYTKEQLSNKYYIKSEIDTPYGKMYLLIDKEKLSLNNQQLDLNQINSIDSLDSIIQPQAVGFWDIVDIGMAVSSWAKLFGEPNWENAGWAVLDNISLVPIIPSLKTVRNSNEAIEKRKNFANKSKENFKKVLNKFKIGKYHIENVFKYILFPKVIRFPTITIKRSQLEKNLNIGNIYD